MAVNEERIARFGDSDLRGISLGVCQCNKCLHVADDGLSCDAFPGGIPMDILAGRVAHTTPFEGDNDIQFEPWPEAV